MKKFASIAAVVGLLLAAAIYYGNMNKQPVGPDVDPQPTPDPQPIVNTPIPVKSTDAPSTMAVQDGTLKLTSAISHGYLAKGPGNDVYATVDIQAIKFQGQSRPPLNIALVIDRSGSMSGEKIEHARDAARKLVDVLSPQDRLAIVSYGSDVTIDFASRQVTVENRPHMLSAIDGITVSGGTNLSGGYERALQEVKRWKDDNSINRVLLMSDGNANIGVTYLPDLERMARQGLTDGVSLTSVGVGLDYNEDLMTRMANEGAGNYHFIDNFNKIAGVLEQELQGLSTTVARNTSVMISLAPGVKLQNLYGYPFRQNGQTVMIPLAEFYSEQSKNILIKLSVPGDMDSKRPVMDVQLSYNDITKDTQAHQKLALHSVVTSNAELLGKAVDVNVISRVQQVEVANTFQQAMDKYESGDVRGAEAMITETQHNMRQTRAKYAPMQKNADFDRVDREMDKLKGSINAAPAASDEGRRLRKSSKARSNYILMDTNSF